MAAFAWHHRRTRHFGEQWAAHAELQLRARSGEWVVFDVQVDTGAVVLDHRESEGAKASGRDVSKAG